MNAIESEPPEDRCPELVAVDTSAIIAAFEPNRPGYAAMRRLMARREAGEARLVVSRRTLHELQEKSDEKLAFARTLEVLPYYMIGTWNDFEPGIRWKDLAGTWNDAKANQQLQTTLPARKKVGLRDRGIIVDAMKAGVRHLLTTDSYILDRASEIEESTGVRPLHPDGLPGG